MTRPTLREMAIEFVQGDFGRHYDTDCDLVEALLVCVEQAAFEMAAEEADAVARSCGNHLPDTPVAAFMSGAATSAWHIRLMAKERAK